MTTEPEPVTPHWRTQAAAFDTEAAHYLRRADQEQGAYGPGFYPNLLRDMAAERIASATQLRAANGPAT